MVTVHGWLQLNKLAKEETEPAGEDLSGAAGGEVHTSNVPDIPDTKLRLILQPTV